MPGSNSGSVGVTGVITTTEKKSPMGSAANSPKPPSTKGGESSEDDDIKSESSTGAGPKVPPLKIVLGGGNEQETSARNGKSVTSRQLPYVVNTSSGEEKELPPDMKEALPTLKVNPDVCQSLLCWYCKKFLSLSLFLRKSIHGGGG